MSKELSKLPKFEKTKDYYTNPDLFVGDLQKLIEYEELDNSKDLSVEQIARKKELTRELSMLHGLENGVWAANLAREQHYPTLAQMRRNIVQDFNCKSSFELMLADRIVAHYWRAMRNDTILNTLTEEKNGGFSFNQQKINIIKALHRGVELSDRQLIANISLLKELKQPQQNIRVTAGNAFIAQNQQFNAVKKTNETE